MRTEVVMPQMGESVAEGTLTQWLKKIGERVERDEPLFEITTDKVDAEIPSPTEGVLVEIRVEPGQTVEINHVVAILDTSASPGDVPAGAPVTTAAPSPAASTAKPEETNVPAARDEAVAPAVPASLSPDSIEDLRRTKSTPLVRKIAATKTLGYNGNYLGPVLRVRRGQQVNVAVHNQLGEPTTVHWHGMDISGEADGGPHQPIMPGEVWEPGFTIDQPAATLWYHPHLHGTTGPQVYGGLAGLVYIEDEVSDSLNLPKDYGVNDIPIILQDRNFNDNGSFSYQVNMMGLVPGDTMLINGTVNPYLEVNREKVRLRILNGSNFESFHLQLSDGSPFVQIASDGGFLESPLERDALFIAPGERMEVIVDFASTAEVETVFMANDKPIMRFHVLDSTGIHTEIPESLTVIPEIPAGNHPTTRVFELQSMGLQGTINGKSFSMNRIDEEVTRNETEIWTIRNLRGMMNASGHPFHVHGTQFQVISRNGSPPPQEERGYKDTIYVDPGEEVVIQVRFHHTGLYMYHCHMLEHEDYGMMGQFMVRELPE